MVIRFYKRNVSFQVIRELCNLNREGVSIEALKFAAEKVGFKALPLKAKLFEEANNMSGNIPLLQELKLPLISFWSPNHFIVIYKIKRDVIYAVDPSRGRVKINFVTAQKYFSPNSLSGKIILLEPTEFFFSRKNTFLKNYSIKGALDFISTHVRDNFNHLSVLFIIVLTRILIIATIPFLAKQAFDSGILKNNIGVLYQILVLQCLLYFINAAIVYFDSIYSNKVSSKVNLHLTREFIEKILAINLSSIISKRSGDIVHRLYDIKRLESFIAKNLVSIVLSLFGALVLSAVISYYEIKILFIVATCSLLYIGWTLFSLNKRSQLNGQKYDNQVTSHRAMTEVVEGICDIKISKGIDRRIERLLNLQKESIKFEFDSTKLTQALNLGSGLINNLSYGIISFYLSFLVIHRAISLGEMAALQLLVSQLNSQVISLVSSATLIQEMRFCLERILEVRSLPNEDSGVNAIIFKSNIQFSDVSFSYNELSPLVLKNINFLIEKGKTTAIVGLSGTGKSTIIKLLLGFYIPNEGDVLVDAVPLRTCDIKEWRTRNGVVNQESYIFFDTIYNNITDFPAIIDQERYLAAIKGAEISDFIESLPIRENTFIGTGGLSLSSGQKQRILLARMIYRNPEILLLDEATNALDSVIEGKILRSLNELCNKSTKIIISHRYSTIREADKVIVIDNGIVVEQGKPEELLNAKQFYYSIYLSQLV